MLRLDARRRILLRTVVEEHVRTAEPVGSRHAALRGRLSVSPATIRSALASMEELGLLTHPHTSAGRIPTDWGYRVYVDMLPKADPLGGPATESIRRRLGAPDEEPGGVVGEAARLLAGMTGYASVAAAPRMQAQAFASLHLVPMGERRALAVIAADSGALLGHPVELPDGVAPDDLEHLSRAITYRLRGTRVADLTYQRLEQVLGEASRQHRWLEEVRAWLLRDLARSARSQIRVAGARHLLAEPEFRTPDRATRLFEILENEPLLERVLSSVPEQGVWIFIGQENQLEQLRLCSLVMTAYRAGEQRCGTIGVIGPTRMRYRSTVAAVRHVAEGLSEAMRSSA